MRDGCRVPKRGWIAQTAIWTVWAGDPAPSTWNAKLDWKRTNSGGGNKVFLKVLAAPIFYDVDPLPDLYQCFKSGLLENGPRTVGPWYEKALVSAPLPTTPSPRMVLATPNFPITSTHAEIQIIANHGATSNSGNPAKIGFDDLFLQRWS